MPGCLPLDRPASGQLTATQGDSAHVLKVYLLEGQVDRENPNWLSVVRFGVPGKLCLFLRDANGYREISRAIALSMLSGTDKRSLLAILTAGSAERGATPSEKNRVERASSEAESGMDMVANELTTSGNALVSDEIFSAGRLEGMGRPFFRDYGHAMWTHSNGSMVAYELVRIAHARGWDAIRVSGSDVFRHAVWKEAAARGIRVRGYLPSVPVKLDAARRPPSVGKTSAADAAEPNMAYHVKSPRIPPSGAEKQRPPEKGNPISQTSSSIDLQNVLIYRYVTEDVQATAWVDPITVYAQAVVMARIYENQLAHGVEPPIVPLNPATEAVLAAEPQF